MGDGSMSRWRVPVIAASVHAAAVLVAVAVNVASVGMNVGGRHGLDAAADALVLVLCLPLTWFARIGRLDAFFALLPLNTVLYALVFWGCWACVGRLRSGTRGR
jgi:hypothetical protein